MEEENNKIFNQAKVLVSYRYTSTKKEEKNSYT
jgi:hypothetical protein